MTDDCNLSLSGLILFRKKVASVLRVDSQRRKQICRNRAALQSFRLVGSRQVVALLIIECNFFKAFASLFEIDEFWHRHGYFFVASSLEIGPKRHQALSIIIRKRSQQDRIYYAEDRAVGADAK